MTGSDRKAAIPVETVSPDTATDAVDPVQQRIAIVDAAIMVFSRQAYRRTTVKDIALEAGISIEELQQHFPKWNGLVLATIDKWNRARLEPLMAVARDDGTLVFMRRLVEDNQADPSLPRLLITVLADATDPEHPSTDYLRNRYQAFHERVVKSFEHDVAMGRVPVDLDCVAAAEHIVSVWEGLQLQRMLRPNMDLLVAFDRALGAMVRDWDIEV